MSEAAPDIFLSYNREDAAVAQTYRDAFEREGFDVWWDATLRSGEAYDEVTEAALRGARAVVVLWSPRSVASRWVRAEATIAARNKTLMPVTIEPCDRPVMFELTQTAELSHWRGAADDKAWLVFLDDVRRMVGLAGSKPAEEAAAPRLTTPSAKGEDALPFVAVLPLAHRAGDEDTEILAEDLTEEITRQLAQNGFFRVIAATTMAAWRGKAVDYRALRRELEAAYLIEGKLQRAGDDVRLTMQLIDAATGSMLQSTRYAHKLADIGAAPEELPAIVSAEFGEHIEQCEMNRAQMKSGPLSGWEHVLRALAYSRRSGSDSSRRAIEEARRAVAAAPELGLAHAMLSQALSVPAGSLGEKIDDELRREIQAHARRAMQLDGDNPTVIVNLISSYAAIGENEACLRLARRAQELSPNSASTLSWLVVGYSGLGRTTEAIAAFKDYERLSRFDRFRHIAIWIAGMCYFIEGQVAEAADAFDWSLALHPDFSNALKWKAIVVEHNGDRQTAVASIRRLREVEPQISLDQHVWQMVRVRKFGELCAEAVEIFRRLWDEVPSEPAA